MCSRWFFRSSNAAGVAAAGSRKDIEAEQTRAIEHMNSLALQLESAMRRYGPVPLGVYSAPAVTEHSERFGLAREGAVCSRALEFLGYLVNGFWERIPLRRARIHQYLPTSRMFVGNENIELRTPVETRFASILDFTDYPEESEPGILNPISESQPSRLVS